MRNILLMMLVAAVALVSAPATAMPTVDELIERANAFARRAGQYTCHVVIEDSSGAAAGRLRVKGDKFRLQIERKTGTGAALGDETVIFDGETLWMLVHPAGDLMPTVLKMDVKLIEEHARRTEEDVRLDRPDRGINVFNALSALRDNYELETLEMIRDDQVEMVMVQARIKPIEERQYSWTGAPLIRLLIEKERGIPIHVARFDYEGRNIFSMTLGEGNSRMPVSDRHISYTPPRQAEVRDLAEMLEEIAREREEVLRRVD